nr:membrane protein [uncultured bacterium]
MASQDTRAVTLFQALRAMLTARRTAWAFALVPLVLAVAVSALLGEAERSASPLDSLPRGADSTVAAALQEDLPK